jgi:hypothetical protein
MHHHKHCQRDADEGRYDEQESAGEIAGHGEL